MPVHHCSKEHISFHLLAAGQVLVSLCFSCADDISYFIIFGRSFEVNTLFPEKKHKPSHRILWGVCIGISVQNSSYRQTSPESHRYKSYIPHHFRIDKTQSFLLALAHKVRAKHFKIVYINEVFVIITTTNRILRSEFIITSHKYF